MDLVIKALIFHTHTSPKEFHTVLIAALMRCLEVRKHAFDEEYQVLNLLYLPAFCLFFFEKQCPNFLTLSLVR